MKKIRKKKPVSQPKRRRKRRRLRPAAILFFVILAAAAALAVIVPRAVDDSKLRSIGYTQKEIKHIRQNKLTKTLIKTKYYSPYLAKCILDDNVNVKYLELYTAADENKGLTPDDFLLYSRLIDAGYEQDQVINLFSKLEFREITPLLVFDYQFDENPYIDDCIAHRDTNSETSFSLSGTYFSQYKNIKPSENKDSLTVLVNRVYRLGDADVPDDITELSANVSTSGMSLRKEAADAFTEWANAAIENKTNFFASASYRSFNDQKASYESFLKTMSEEEADKRCARPGHSEHQTGLAVNITPTFENDPEFKNTKTAEYAFNTCTDYGFIPRYPEEKKQITGMEGEPEHFRYLGKELAKSVSASNFTYDEFYALYLKNWDEEENKPEDAILSACYYVNAEKAAPKDEQEEAQSQ